MSSNSVPVIRVPWPRLVSNFINPHDCVKAVKSNPNNDFCIDAPPKEPISKIEFNPSSNIIAVASWDHSIKCYRYEICDKQLTSSICGINKHNAAILSCCWNNNGSTLFSGGCDNNIFSLNFGNKTITSLIGTHQSSIKCLSYSNKYNILISGSWDKTLKYWDIRSNKTLISPSINTQSKIYCMSQRDNSVVIGLSNKYIQHYDLRKFTKYISSRRSILKQQLKCVEIFPDNRGFIAGSLEGRCEIKHFLNTHNQRRDFSFKCHRYEKDVLAMSHRKYVFSVNVIKFIKDFAGSFVTGGDDGLIVCWDKDKRERIKKFNTQIKIENMKHTFMSITSIDFSRNNRFMAYSTSYNWNKGIINLKHKKNMHEPQIFLHRLTSNELCNGCKLNNCQILHRLVDPTSR